VLARLYTDKHLNATLISRWTFLIQWIILLRIFLIASVELRASLGLQSPLTPPYTAAHISLIISTNSQLHSPKLALAIAICSSAFLLKKRNLNCGENTDGKTNAVSPECEI
jgi:hypothetical protein